MYEMKALSLYGLFLLAFSSPCFAQESVNLQLKWQHQFQFAGYYAAKIKGFYQEVGLDVNIIEGDSHVNIIERVSQGHAEYGTGNSDILLAYHKGEPLVVLAVIMQHSPYVLVTRKDQSFQSIHDMAGKRLMIEPHAEELIAYLLREGVEPGSYQRTPYTDLQRFIDEEVDAVSVYLTDELFLLQQAGIEFNTYYPASAGVDFYGDNLFTTKEELQNNPDRVRRFREASLRGWNYALNNPDEIINYIVEAYPERHSREQLVFEAEKMRQLMYPDLIEIGYMMPGRWQHISNTYGELGLLPTDYKADGLLYSPRNLMQYSKKLARAMAGWAVTALILLVIGVLAYKLYRANQRLHTSLQYKNQLANVGESFSNISHQWKQPLNEMGIYFMRIQQLISQDARQELSEAEYLVGKGNELLEFMADTVESFGQVVGSRNQLVMFSPRKAVEDLLRLQSDGLKNSGISVNLSLDSDAEVYGNVASFIHSLMNVIGNAREVLVARQLTHPEISLTSTVQDGAYQIAIKDNAGGIAEDKLRRIFDIGYSDKSEGSGLGLYIARNIIRDQFQGSLTAKNTSEGLCFEFKVPLPEDKTNA